MFQIAFEVVEKLSCLFGGGEEGSYGTHRMRQTNDTCYTFLKEKENLPLAINGVYEINEEK